MADLDQDVGAFRQHLPDLSIPRFTIAGEQDAHSYVAAFRQNHIPPWLYDLTQTWEELLEEPFRGVTVDAGGTVRPDLYEADEVGIDIERISQTANAMLSRLSDSQLDKLRFPINARQWRAWSNPEFLLRDYGLRLDELPVPLIEAILSVMEASLSPEGYTKAISAMRINHFLGELCEIPKIMNQYSYNFLLFGEPSATKAWGWNLYGHHLCLNVFFKGGHVVISPTFTGAEPNAIDVGPWAGTQILKEEGDLGLQLMQSLSQDLRDQAQTFKLMRDPGMLQSGDLKVDRWNKDDQRHLCGAFRDNRQVPNAGISATSLSSAQQALLLRIIEHFHLYLPSQARAGRLRHITAHLQETYFSWIGGYGDHDPFYFRIQSPVVVCELDHHSGVFLTNEEPKKFHTHTIVRMPNGGDYGNAIRKAEEKLE